MSVDVPQLVITVFVLYFFKCFVLALPAPSGGSGFYLFVYRLSHLLLANVDTIIASAGTGKLPQVLNMSEQKRLQVDLESTAKIFSNSELKEKPQL